MTWSRPQLVPLTSPALHTGVWKAAHRCVVCRERDVPAGAPERVCDECVRRTDEFLNDSTERRAA